MSNYYKYLNPFFLSLLLIFPLSCQRKVNEDAQAAQEVANSADDRIAALEKQIEEIKAGKQAPSEADKDTVQHVSQSQTKALERQLAHAKKNAQSKQKMAQDLASAPSQPSSKAIVVTVPEGTSFSVTPSKEISTANFQAGDPWDGILAEDVRAGDRTVWKKGTAVSGVVTQSIPVGRLSSGQGSLGIKVTTIGQEDVDTAAYVVLGDKRGTRNAKYIGGGAALGALIGLLSDSKNQGSHALGGAALGAAAGTATAAATADTVIRIPASQVISFSLSSPEKIMLRS